MSDPNGIPRKAAANRRDHGIAFEEVGEAFRDPFAVEWIDGREDYGEERVNMLAMCGGIVLHVTYAERNDHSLPHFRAAADPDARPIIDAEMHHPRQVPRAKTLRRALALTQEEFTARYRIPLGTLRDWEQGRVTPDQPTRAYLTVIARDPDGVRRALDRQPV